MAQQNNQQKYCSLAALRYAQVLYERQTDEEAVERTKMLWQESPELREALKNPAVSRIQKHRVIDRVFPAGIRSFLKVLTDHDKAGLLEEILEAYEERKQAAQGVITATLRYTTLPTEEQKQRMEHFLCKTEQASSVDWKLVHDETLLGGFILSVGDKEYDYSVEGRLSRLEQKLTWR